MLAFIPFSVPPVERTEAVIKIKAVPIENIPTAIFTGVVNPLFPNFLHISAITGARVIPRIELRAANHGTGTLKLPKFLFTWSLA